MPKMKNVLFFHFIPSTATGEELKPQHKRVLSSYLWDVVKIRDETLKELPLFPIKFPHWQIIKVLTINDIEFIPGLELDCKQVQDYILKHLDPGNLKLMLMRKQRIPIQIHDLDTDTHHSASLGKCYKDDNFCLQGGWSLNFVYRRNLKPDMRIGLYWEISTSTLCFSVLNDIPESSETTSEDNNSETTSEDVPHNS